MHKLLSRLRLGALTVAVAATTVVPLNAAPVAVGMPDAIGRNVITVQSEGDDVPRNWMRRQMRDRQDMRREIRRDRREFRRDVRDARREFRRDRREARRFYRRGDDYYYNGHRGYRYHRPGYREYNGWWFPTAAFVAGALVGGAAASQSSAGGSSHVEWCASRYRSYRAYDNTFQPYNGPRRQCVSPYS